MKAAFTDPCNKNKFSRSTKVTQEWRIKTCITNMLNIWWTSKTVARKWGKIILQAMSQEIKTMRANQCTICNRCHHRFANSSQFLPSILTDTLYKPTWLHFSSSRTLQHWFNKGTCSKPCTLSKLSNSRVDLTMCLRQSRVAKYPTLLSKKVHTLRKLVKNAREILPF